MQLNFKFDPMRTASYCVDCYEEFFRNDLKNDEGNFVCLNCGFKSPRTIIIDPTVKWWLSEGNVYNHASAGIIFADSQDKVLFFELTKFPYGLTVPAGHVDMKESPIQAAVREAKEETGLKIADPRLILKAYIQGDQCRRGCDDHEWSLFIHRVTNREKMSLSLDASEGKAPVWLKMDKIVSSITAMPLAMQYLFGSHFAEIETAILKR